MQDAVCVCTPPEIFFFFLPMQRELNGVERGKKYMMFKLLTLCVVYLISPRCVSARTSSQTVDQHISANVGCKSPDVFISHHCKKI